MGYRLNVTTIGNNAFAGCKALKKLGYEIVLVNSNPATIMTDKAMAD